MSRRMILMIGRNSGKERKKNTFAEREQRTFSWNVVQCVVWVLCFVLLSIAVTKIFEALSCLYIPMEEGKSVNTGDKYYGKIKKKTEK